MGLLGLAAGAGLCSAFAADAVPSYVTAAVNDRGRTPWDMARDAARKPADVLTFSGVKPGMAVIDLVPGEGYYTRMLTKLVGPKGRVYAVVPGGGGLANRSSRMQMREGKPPSAVPKDEAQACVLGCYPTGRPPYMLAIDNLLALQNIAEYGNLTVLWEDVGQHGGDVAAPEQVDVVFIAEGYHELHYQNLTPLPNNKVNRPPVKPKPLDVAAIAKSVFADLKPGGVFIVEDHAAAKGAGFTQADALHRTDADAARAEITAAGFVLDGESKVLTNAADDHTKPAGDTWAQQDKTDRYLLRFKKPANANPGDKRPKDENAVMGNYYGNTQILGVGMKSVTPDGNRIRHVFYNPDHTYEEFGRVGEGVAPMQAGTWFWDALGYNCMIHQFPIDERANLVCHEDIVSHPIGVVEDQKSGASAIKVEIVKGWVRP
jgi:predicted methyltransferase